jgi:predicted lipoprotein with Yx(FWY)xxD motif
MRKNRIAFALAGAALAALTLAGCSGGSGSAGGAYGGNAPKTSTSSASGTGSDAGNTLKTASSSLGQIVVDGKGMTVYYYGKDTKGETASACTGQCLTQWPPVTASATPSVSGISGTVGTITGANGTKQVTIDGLPIYYFAGDSKAGDVSGQLVGNIWWAVAPDGSKITSSASGGAGGY